MDNSPKILLTILLEGGTLISKSNIDKCMSVKDLQEKGFKVINNDYFKNKEYFRPAMLHVKIPAYSYDHMSTFITKKAMFKSKKINKKPTSRFLLESSLSEICIHHKGIAFKYQIFE